MNYTEIEEARKWKKCTKCQKNKRISAFSVDSGICVKCEKNHVYPEGCHDPRIKCKLIPEDVLEKARTGKYL